MAFISTCQRREDGETCWIPYMAFRNAAVLLHPDHHTVHSRVFVLSHFAVFEALPRCSACYQRRSFFLPDVTITAVLVEPNTCNSRFIPSTRQKTVPWPVLSESMCGEKGCFGKSTPTAMCPNLLILEKHPFCVCLWKTEGRKENSSFYMVAAR